MQETRNELETDLQNRLNTSNSAMARIETLMVHILRELKGISPARVSRTMTVGGSVGAGATVNTDSAAIPNGRRIRVLKFKAWDGGGAGASKVTAQWGVPGSFEDIAVILTGETTESVHINEEFTGDGSKFFRLVRTNSGLVGKRMVAILQGFEV